MSGDDSFARYLCLSVDVQGYSRGNDRAQCAVQDELLSLLAAAAHSAGLARETWIRQGSGDGELALIPAGESEAAVVEGFVGELAGLLYSRNCDRSSADRLRLRLAVDHGLVRSAANGFAGRQVIVVSRLVNAAPAKQALVAAPDASLAVVLSQRVYADLVVGGHTRLDPGLFRRVWVQDKEFVGHVWLRVPGTDVHRLALTPDPTVRARGGQGPEAAAAAGSDPPAVRGVTAEHSYVAMGDGNVVGTGNVVLR